MKYILCILALLAVNVSCGSVAQQQYRSHTVAQGETVYSISKKYNISEADIYKLNPDAKSGVKTGSVLILPTSGTIASSQNTPVAFKKHRVKRKETLFSISQKYNVSVDDLKKYNKALYARPLKKGEKIQIPIFGPSEDTSITNTVITEENNKPATHTVLPKETVYGIARKYGITVKELQTLNPGLGEDLKIGAVLNVPEKAVVETATIDDAAFNFYEVQPKEGFFRLKVKFGLTEEEIIALNPYAKDGLKEGMVLKIPKAGNESASETVTKINLEYAIRNRSKKQVALMLPFQLQKVKDSVAANEALLKNSSVTRIALDFYSGVLMATEFAKDKGISVELSVFDTQGSASKINSILSQNNFSTMDAVVGPLLSNNVERVASQLKSDDIPVISPLSNKNIKITSNLFQTMPTDAMLEDKMLQYIKENALGKNMLLISDASRKIQQQKIISEFPTIKTVSLRKESYLYLPDIQDKLDNTGGENWVVLESNNSVLVSNVVSLLNGLPDSYNVRLVTLDRNDAYDYDDVSNIHLANLNFTFPSVNKNYNYKDKTPFLVSYKNKYGVLPNKYAVRGFDIMYDVLLRLASSDDLYEASKDEFETEYVENKFIYKKKLFSGYQNTALYIIKFTEDLQFEVLK